MGGKRSKGKGNKTNTNVPKDVDKPTNVKTEETEPQPGGSRPKIDTDELKTAEQLIKDLKIEDQKESNTGADESNTGRDKSKTEGDESKTEGEESKTEGDDSKAESAESKVEGDESKTEGDESNIEDEESKTEGEESKTEGDESKTEVDESKTEVDESKTGGDELKAEGDISKNKGDKSETEGEESKTVGDESKTEDDESKTGGDKSKTERDELKTEGVEPKTEGEEPKIEGDESKIEGDDESKSYENQPKSNENQLEDEQVEEYVPMPILETSRDIINFLNDKVAELLHFRQYFFELFGPEEAVNREKHFDEKIKQVLPYFNEYENRILKDDQDSILAFKMLKARALNVLTKHQLSVCKLLWQCISIKQDYIDAWLELGECYWRAEKFTDAYGIFDRVTKMCRNKVALRTLALLIVSVKSPSLDEGQKKTDDALKYAKLAIQLDPSDSESWCFLGSVYLSAYYNLSETSEELMRKCLKCFDIAEKDKLQKYNPAVHFNRAIAYRNLHEYKLSLESFVLAHQYRPIWDVPPEKHENLLRYLNDIMDGVNKRGKLKQKRIDKLINAIDSKQLGPYADTNRAGPSTEVYDEVMFEDLHAGLNKRVIVLGKVLGTIPSVDVNPLTFCIMDRKSNCVAVAVHNMAKGKGVTIGDSVAVPKPYVIDVDFVYQEKQIKFRLIRIKEPKEMVLNSKQLSGVEYHRMATRLFDLKNV